MNVGAEVPKLLKKISNNEKQRIEKLQCMQSAYIKMTEYLQENLPLDSGFIADMVCLHPLKGKDAAAVNRISRIAQCMPHVIEERSIVILIDSGRTRRQEEIDERWVFNEDGRYKPLYCY